MRRTRGSWLGLALAPLLLAACGPTVVGGPSAGGGTPAPSATTGRPTATATGSRELTCTLATSIEGVDVIKQVLACAVKGAPTSETSFTLTYSATDGQGRQREMAPACTGTLRQGAGACAQVYTSPAPIGSGPGSVSGVTAPHGYVLGPVVPAPVAAPPGTPIGPAWPLQPGDTLTTLAARAG